MGIKTYKKSVRKFEKRHHIFSALLVGAALILFWRGTWYLADEYLFPNNHVLSAVVSIIIAFIILYFRDFDLKELFAH